MTPDEQKTDGFLRFDRTQPAGRKTPVVYVFNNDDGSHLGHISWYGAWRQFCFFPSNNCVFHRGCLEGVNRQLVSLMAERKVKRS